MQRETKKDQFFDWTTPNQQTNKIEHQNQDLNQSKQKKSLVQKINQYFSKHKIVPFIILIIGVYILLNIFSIAFYNKGYRDALQIPRELKIPINIKTTDTSNNQQVETKLDFSIFVEVLKTLQSKYYDRDNINFDKLLEGAIKGMVNSLDDPFSEFLTANDKREMDIELSGTFNGIGAEVSKKNGKIIIVTPLKNTPADKAGLLPGDEILEVDNEPTYDMDLDTVVSKIRGKKGTKVELLINRPSWDKPRKFVIERNAISVPSSEISYLPNNIALLKIYNFYQPLDFEFPQNAYDLINKTSKGIVLDLRNDPGGYLDTCLNISDWFFQKGATILIEDYKNAAPQKLYKSSRNGLLKDIPIVVLVNKGTASAAEILAGALHDNRNVLIVGEKTFGKGSVQELINLPGNNSLKITIAHWLTPKGIDISKKGIVPDIEIKIPESEISSAYAETSLEKDIQLKRAYDELLKIINK